MKRFLATVCATLWVLPSALYAQGLGASQLILTNSSGGGVILQPNPAATSVITYTLPADLTPTSTVGVGILQTNASGNLSWLSPTALAALVEATAWALTGNAIIGTEFLGTTNAQPLVIRTNNTERMRITAAGDVVVQNQASGTPTTVLQVLGGNGGAGATQVVIQAGASQSGVDLLRWQNNGGDPLGSIRPDGSVVLVYDPPARQAFFAVANPSGVPLIGIGPNPSGWGVGVYEPIAPYGDLRAGMGKVGTEWWMGVGDLGAQNGVLLNWATTTTLNEPRIVVANGSLANPVFLVDREGDVTVRGTTVALPNIPNNSAATEVLVWNAGNVQRRSAEGLAWLLTGNSITSAWNGTSGNFLGTTNAQPLVIATTNTASPQPIQFWTNNTERMRITATGDVGIGTASPTERLQVSDGNIAITNTDGTARELRLYEPFDGTNNYTAFRAQAQTSNITYTLPASLTPTSTVAAGILQTDGSGNLSWLTPSALVSGGAWALTGNSGTNPAVNFLGTTDAQPLVIRTNNTERMRITAAGDVVVQNQASGTPTTVLQVLGGNGGAGATQVVLRAGANQSGVDLLQWRNKDGDPLGVIRPDGSVVLVYDPPARQAFFAVANPSGVPLIGIGPDPSGWGVGVYEPIGPFGQLRAGMGKVGTEWWMGVGDLGAQNGVLLNWATTTTLNEPRIVVANGSLANPVFLVDREGDVTVRGTTVALPNIPDNSAATEVLVWNAGNVQRRSAEGLAWLLTGNSGTDPAVNFLGTTDAQPLVIRTNNTERMRITAAGDVVVQNQASGTPTTVLQVLGGNNGAGATQVVLRAGANQSGVDLLQWRNKDGDPLGVIRPDGSVVLVYDPPARQAFFAVANPSGVPLIGIGPDPSGWGVGVYEPIGPFGQLRAGMGKVGTEWWMGVGDLAAQNGVLLNWATTGTANEPRIVVANGSLANPVFLVDREGDVTVRGTTVALPNIPDNSAATEVLVWNAGNVQRRSAEGLAWLLTGNSGTNPAVNFLGTTDAQPLVIRVNNAQTFQFNTNLSLQRDAGGNTRGQGAVDLQSARSAATQVASGDYSVIGGGQNNTASGGGATVGGGSDNTASGGGATVGGGVGNTASVDGATVGGGSGNTASGYAATVGGGQENTASGDVATVGGGSGNTASGYAATVGGGSGNTASGYAATVGGGESNTASANFATVGGGESNTASANFATVGGGYLNDASGYAATVGGGESNTASANFATVGGGESNTASANFATVGGGRENTASGYAATVGGGEGNTASGGGATVGGGSDNTASGGGATVGGGVGNTASVDGATVGGGVENTASGKGGTVGGGYTNTASGFAATVGGGWSNTAIDDYATVGGGRENTASGSYATVGGGVGNTASGSYATVGGGWSNTASGSYATVGGGWSNTASGDFSAIPGGFYLRVGERSFGFSGQTTAAVTDLSANSNIAAFVDVDLWLYSRDRTQASQLRFYEAQAHTSGPEYVAFQAPNTLTTSTTYTLPADLTAGPLVANARILQSDDDGNLSWLSPAALVTGSAWALTGNSGTNPAVNFLGTTDEQPLVIRTDNTERMRITETGDVGIGTNTPAATLDVNGTVAFSATATLTNNGNPLTLPSNVAVVEIADGAGAADINVNPPTTGTQGQVLFIRYSGTQNLTLVGVLPGGGNQTATAQFHAILMYIGGGWRLMSFVD